MHVGERLTSRFPKVGLEKATISPDGLLLALVKCVCVFSKKMIEK